MNDPIIFAPIPDGEKVYLGEEARERIWADAHGLTKSTGKTCVHRLTGAHCRRGLGLCTAERDAQERHIGWDHASLWNKDGRPHVIILQPYQYNEEALRAWCDQYGLAYTIQSKAHSWYYPHGTYLIEIRAA